MTLKELRESRLWTQAFLAQKIGVQVPTVSNWERGEQRPQMSLMLKLADAFGISPSEIVSVIEDTIASTKK